MTRTLNLILQLQRERMRALRAQERASNASERAAKAAVRERARQQRERLRQQVTEAVREGERQAAEMNAELEARRSALSTLLLTGLARNPIVDFDSLKDRSSYPSFVTPAHLAAKSVEPRPESYVPAEPNLIGKWFGKQKYERALLDGRRAYETARSQCEAAERLRVAKLDRRREQHEHESRDHAERTERQNQEIDEFKRQYLAGEQDAVRAYCELVLAASHYPDGCPSEHKIRYIPDSKQVVVDHQLPTLDVIPEVGAFRYVKARHDVEPSSAKLPERKAFYAEVVSAISLRTIQELFSADVGARVDVVVFNGYVQTVDPGTGKDSQPYLITAKATRDEMATLDLERVDPMACLRHLDANVSLSPSELQPVQPIVELGPLLE